MKQVHPNPYVGPRPFRQGETIYGRNRETREIVSLLVAKRIVLLYSPSGAGKTSLIQADLIPRLEERDFRVIPSIRINTDPKNQYETNRYILSVLNSIEKHTQRNKQFLLDNLSAISLTDYLSQQFPLSNQEEEFVLIFDQFEEVITNDPTDQHDKHIFFEQLGKALYQMDNCWVLFAMREEYIASLEPFIDLIPGQLKDRYRLELPSEKAAKQAIQEPSRMSGIEFTDGAAKKLVDDLRYIKIQQPDGRITKQLGPYIEPVQLQVVCRQLWDSLGTDTQVIDIEELKLIDSVDKSLTNYYNSSVAAIARVTKQPQRYIREWFDQHLIIDQGIRGQVLRGYAQSGGLDNSAIQKLVDAHLVREEQRRGATWYELTHDRLIEPILQSNKQWLERRAGSWRYEAERWSQAGRIKKLLLQDSDQLHLAKKSLADNPKELTTIELEFLYASISEQKKRYRMIVVPFVSLMIGYLIIALIYAATNVLL